MKKIAALGEVLFDCFNGKELIGGAPFNFIYHICRFTKVYGLDYAPAMITKIGNDQRGHRVHKLFNELNMPANLLQHSDELETGVVNVNINREGIPEYKIIENSAYDFIDFDAHTEEYISNDLSFFYFGSLFQRTIHNRATLACCLPDENIHTQKAFFDINLRQNYYNWDILDNSLLSANYLKINTEELEILKTFFAKKTFPNQLDFIEFLLEEYVLDSIILTKGEKGAAIYDSNGDYWERDGRYCHHMKDTVGAGDSFASVFALGQLLGWPQEEILERAIQFSSDICKIEGATPGEISWYDQYKHWF